MGRGTSDKRKLTIYDTYKRAGKNRGQGYKQRMRNLHNARQQKK